MRHDLAGANNDDRTAELVLLGARPGLGKTTFALQVARNLAVSGKSVVFFSFEHDNHSLLERLIVLEAAEISGSDAVRLPEVRKAFSVSQGADRMMMEGRLFAPREVSRPSRRCRAIATDFTCTVPAGPKPTSRS